MALEIRAVQQKIIVQSSIYRWEWDRQTDTFSIYDGSNHLIGQGRHQPLILTTRHPNGQVFDERRFETDKKQVSIIYGRADQGTRITLNWLFEDDFILLEPLEYRSSSAEDVIRVVYFAEALGDSYKPSFYSRYAVVPGLSMSPNLSPVVDLHSRLSTTVVLGTGAMRGPGLTQQWGLPAHYFCTFNTAEHWNAIGARDLQSGAACWGLAELPDGDFRMELHEIGLSPVLNLRRDVWNLAETPGTLRLGLKFLIAFGAQFHEAIRSYYRILLREKIIQPKQISISSEKNKVLLSPQYNTWGVESALSLRPEEFNESILFDGYHKFRQSGMKAGTFVVDDKWEGRYGELSHDEARFPHFMEFLKTLRKDGFFVGLWAAFLRCQDPSTLGLDESNLLRTKEGDPLWLSHHSSRYGIFDVTQPFVQKVLQERARRFIRKYRPDLIKFDFGYELPSLDVAAPTDMKWAGERLLQKGLEVIVGTMMEENPDLVIMYYGLSPLLIDYYDLHSPDDLVYCNGDYDLETNRRIFFSSLCGELGMPTYGSSGYDWNSALDIWFDSVASGTLGSLHCFDGDENGDLPKVEWIAKYNGLCAILRKSPSFSVHPVDAIWQGGLRAAFSPSWERVENGKSVLLALRTHRFDSRLASPAYKDVLHKDVTLVVASMTEDEISCTARLGIVPFGNGSCTIRHVAAHATATVVEHYFSGAELETQIPCQDRRIQLSLHQSRNYEVLEWLEILFKD